MYTCLIEKQGLYRMAAQGVKTTKAFAYRLHNTGQGSHKFGPCERCGKPAGTVYLLSQMRRYTRGQREGVTYEGCFNSVFGHKECLVVLTEERSSTT